MHPSCSPTPAATPMEFEGTLRVTLWVGGVGGECCFTVKCLKAPSVSGELLKFRLTVECWPPAGPGGPHIHTSPNPTPQMKSSGNFHSSFNLFTRVVPSGVCHLPELREIPSLWGKAGLCLPQAAHSQSLPPTGGARCQKIKSLNVWINQESNG